jgi:nifR3 family TIM-barrel protein
LTTALSIGNLTLQGNALLAPMSGVTDVVMRRIAARLGAAAVVSEMVACDYFVARDAETMLRAEGAGITPHIVQLAGRDPAWMAEAARLAEACGADVVDINMGCPAKRVTGGYAGSALMRDLDLAGRLIAAAVAAVSVPVTVKMRLGWDEDSLNAATLAARAEALGAQLITVHARTRAQFYKGTARWGLVAPVVRATALPVIVNGDIGSVAEARRALAESGAHGVMIGRAALGRPWLVGAINRALAGQAPAWLAPGEVADIAIEH